MRTCAVFAIETRHRRTNGRDRLRAAGRQRATGGRSPSATARRLFALRVLAPPALDSCASSRRAPGPGLFGDPRSLPASAQPAGTRRKPVEPTRRRSHAPHRRDNVARSSPSRVQSRSHPRRTVGKSVTGSRRPRRDPVGRDDSDEHHGCGGAARRSAPATGSDPFIPGADDTSSAGAAAAPTTRGGPDVRPSRPIMRPALRLRHESRTRLAPVADRALGLFRPVRVRRTIVFDHRRCRDVRADAAHEAFVSGSF